MSNDDDRQGTHWATCWRDGGRRHWQCAVAVAAEAKADLAKWLQAFGLLTTLAPNLEIDVTDPIGMAQQIERHVLQHQAIDPFWPNWSTSPRWANYHTIDASGQGVWWSRAGIVLGADAWYHDAETDNSFCNDTTICNLDGLDWQNSLRARAQVK